MANKKIKNIIFDLGGVIIDLDTSKTISAFSELTGLSDAEIVELSKHDIFKAYEKGEVSSAHFRDSLRSIFNFQVSDRIIDDAWNAMIGETPIHRMEWLLGLKEKYRVFILSNTNDIHIDFVHCYLQSNHDIRDFSNHVETAYFSQRIGMRKPDTEIFEYVIDTNALIPQETLFLDDNIDNIQGASLVGIETMQVLHPENVPNLLNNAGIKI